MASIFQKIFRFDHVDSLRVRLITVGILLAVGVLLSLGAVLIDSGRYIGVAVTTLIVVGSCYEVARLFARDEQTLRYRPVFGALVFLLLVLPAVGAVAGSVPSVMGYSFQWISLMVPTFLAAQGVMLLCVFEGRSRLERGASVSQQLAPAFLLLSISAPQLIVMSSLQHGVMLIWFTVAVVAGNDVSAYFVGKRFGTLRLAPALSPNKTVEGAVAGLIGGCLAGVLFWAAAGDRSVSVSAVALVCCAATIASQCADLTKSYFKRLRGVKDTGSLLPGHGGVLDRFDAMIGAAPLVVAAVSLFGV